MSTQQDGITLPPPLPLSDNPPRILIIGAGSRGRGYGQAVNSPSCNGIVHAVAEPDAYKRKQLGRCLIWGEEPAPEGAEFEGWRDFIDYEKQRRERVRAGEKDVRPGVDAAFVCVLDEMHRDVVVALAELGGLHIMCEKPLATNLADCVAMYRALQASRVGDGDQAQSPVFSIGHVLRYSPHNTMLRDLVLRDGVVGDVLSVVHTEPVGWWHFTHSYVRGNWRREDITAPSLLTKSCHDMDVLLWLLCSPPSYLSGQQDRPHLPSTVSSIGSLQYFKKSRKPAGAGEATNCFSCPIEASCKYSAKKIYLGPDLAGLGTGNTHWPVSIVVPDIESYGAKEAAHEALVAELVKDYDKTTPDSSIAARNWFGRCVYECDNDVCDEQIVNITWDEDPIPCNSSTHQSSAGAVRTAADPVRGRGAKSATFHMVAQTKKMCDRYTHIYGVDGEIYADSTTITVEDFNTGKTTTHVPRRETLGHGGGDLGLTRQFILAVDKVKNAGWTSDKSQRELIGCTLEEVIRSHAMVFCAEEARRTSKVVEWEDWWTRNVASRLG